jgi:catechol 2,3-dioxygenase-like lactoylglutathione lyase family enzyme
MITALAHSCFIVRDLDAALDFYVDKLGLEPAFDFINEEGKRFGVYLKVGGRSFIELFIGTPELTANRGSYQHLCLEVDDLQASVEALREKGIEASEPFFGSDNSWQSWIADPDGNRIELHCYTETSKQLPHLG